jgi:hypothetical protein
MAADNDKSYPCPACNAENTIEGPDGDPMCGTPGCENSYAPILTKDDDCNEIPF